MNVAIMLRSTNWTPPRGGLERHLLGTDSVRGTDFAAGKQRSAMTTMSLVFPLTPEFSQALVHEQQR
jgi:hypothetical protein